VASLSKIADDVRAALTTATTARTQLLTALDAIEPASTSYAQLGQGSTQPDLPTAAALTQQSADTIRQALATIDKAIDAACAWLVNIVGPASTAPKPSARSAPAAPTRPAWQLDATTVERLRDELPPPITAADRGTGRKVHGRWVGGDGVTRAVVSGADEWSEYADEVFGRMGYLKLSTTRHAEMKLAARMRAEFERTGQPQHASVVQIEEPCPRRWGCAMLLPVMLPEGCSLTVHAPNYRRTFTGGLRP
jgi:SCP1.201-like deaminase